MSGGQDGPETPPAPESPRPEPPQEPTEPAVEERAEPAGDEGAESGRPRLLPVWILLGAAALSGGAWAVMDNLGDGPPPDEASVPLITASTEPWKVRPDDPGGMEIPNQGTLIYETLTTADPEEAPRAHSAASGRADEPPAARDGPRRRAGGRGIRCRERYRVGATGRRRGRRAGAGPGG